MATFQHHGQTYIVPDEVIADYQPQASPAADDDASRGAAPTRSEDPDDASRARENTTDTTEAAPAPARKKSTRKS